MVRSSSLDIGYTSNLLLRTLYFISIANPGIFFVKPRIFFTFIVAAAVGLWCGCSCGCRIAVESLKHCCCFVPTTCKWTWVRHEGDQFRSWFRLGECSTKTSTHAPNIISCRVRILLYIWTNTAAVYMDEYSSIMMVPSSRRFFYIIYLLQPIRL